MPVVGCEIIASNPFSITVWFAEVPMWTESNQFACEVTSCCSHDFFHLTSVNQPPVENEIPFSVIPNVISTCYELSFTTKVFHSFWLQLSFERFSNFTSSLRNSAKAILHQGASPLHCVNDTHPTWLIFHRRSSGISSQWARPLLILNLLYCSRLPMQVISDLNGPAPYEQAIKSEPTEAS